MAEVLTGTLESIEVHEKRLTLIENNLYIEN